VISEESPLGSDFLAMLQRDGEAAAMKASAAGIRVVNLRIPAVLGGDALRRGMGRVGSGQQWNSWVSRDELASIIHHVLVTDDLAGPVNPVSPNPVRNAESAETISRVLGRKPGMPLPAWMLRLALGELADALLLASRRIQPGKLLATGYGFRFPKLEDAVRHELSMDR
jgi:NAD dependent epimerase/dehydratase family enzyme